MPEINPKQVNYFGDPDDLDLDKIKGIWDDKGVSNLCSSCGHGLWLSGGRTEACGFPAVVLICEWCGLIRMHGAHRLVGD